jgi:hypothetical protein
MGEGRELVKCRGRRVGGRGGGNFRLDISRSKYIHTGPDYLAGLMYYWNFSLNFKPEVYNFTYGLLSQHGFTST